ncbi:hypothetical protein LB507_009813 [Fusarium sp. FIESC RH6]|nr:hypothetical protein LB507_009813 [Fusarium sp. FIESC RH6]
MPSSIPYDPSLTLMSVVTGNALNNVKEIAALQEPVTAAQDALNSLISSKRSLTMTRTELRNLGVPTDSLDAEIKSLDGAIEKAAGDYSMAKMVAEPQIMAKRKNIHSAPNASMNMDVHYFSFDSNSQSTAAYSAQIASYVSGTAGNVFGAEKYKEMGTAASRQVSRQLSQHIIEGTLMLSVGCTHKNASVVAPFVLHVDKAIEVWNSLFPGNKLDPTDGKSMIECAMNGSQEDKEKFSIISGTTFGSCFVGMVHILNTADASASESMSAAASSMKASLDMGSWFANKSGKVGIDSKFANHIKNLLNQQKVQSHITVLSMGIVPSMVASDVSNTVDKFANFDPKVNMASVAGMQSAAASSEASVQSFVENARMGCQVPGLQDRTVDSAMSALTAIEASDNKVFDVNSMMVALDDYLKKVAEGTSGVPINYYLKDIDQKMLAETWVAKYYPGKFMSIKYDDMEEGGPAAENGEQRDRL